MSAPVEITAFTMPASIRSVTISPCLATVMAPASVITDEALTYHAPWPPGLLRPLPLPVR